MRLAIRLSGMNEVAFLKMFQNVWTHVVDIEREREREREIKRNLFFRLKARSPIREEKSTFL